MYLELIRYCYAFIRCFSLQNFVCNSHIYRDHVMHSRWWDLIEFSVAIQFVQYRYQSDRIWHDWNPIITSIISYKALVVHVYRPLVYFEATSISFLHRF